jgi:hypothetical protein
VLPIAHMLQPTQPCSPGPSCAALSGVEEKIAKWTLLPPGNGEGLQVLRYTKSQHYDAVSCAPLTIPLHCLVRCCTASQEQCRPPAPACLLHCQAPMPSMLSTPSASPTPTPTHPTHASTCLHYTTTTTH